MKLQNWLLNYKKYENLPSSIPCSLYSVLLKHSLIEDPFKRTNEYKISELSKEGCEFHTTFDIDSKMLNFKNIYLKFHGLDTLCTIKLNGSVIARTDNMHRIYEFPIKSDLVLGENRLQIFFKSPDDYVQEMNNNHYLWTTENSLSGSGHIRKALYMFGWDWGPVLPDMGIFKDVEILAYNNDKLDNVQIYQKHSDNVVELKIVLEGKGTFENTSAKATLSIDKEVYFCNFNGLVGSITVENPNLWWPNGYGEQNLYHLKIELFENDCLLDCLEKNIGLRTLTVSTKPDKYGNEFAFIVNGIKIFSMGANYVPEDSILSRITKEKTEEMIKNCVEANFNTIRVWGGGYYPNDDFFELCDKNGLIVWQDFMFACVSVYLRADFEETIKAEFIDNIKRIRHHASLGLLCGNNENEGLIEYMCNGLNTIESEHVKSDYLKLYEKILPDICDKYAPYIFYWPSSPSSEGGFDNPNSENIGDTHYWDVWHGNQDFEAYRSHYFRFCSEFGFESFPSLKTIYSFADDKDLNPFSFVMESHQKCKSGNSKILTYCANNYLYANNFEMLIYASQLVQADAIKYGVEHFRRYRGRCMGAIYWQLNDCWPVASWSSIDYFGRWKALHYAAKKFYAPVLLSAHEDGYNVTLNVSNETMALFKGRVNYSVKDNNFNEIINNYIDIDVTTLSSKDIINLDLTEFLKGNENERYLVYSLINNENQIISTQSLLFVKPKHYNFQKPDINIKIKKENDSSSFYISSNTYTKNVEIDFKNLDLVLSDNYFDIVSKNPIIIHTETDATAEDLKNQILIKSVFDIK